MNIDIHKELSYSDNEETIIKEIQEMIDEIYCSHPILHYGSRPKIILDSNTEDKIEGIKLTNTYDDKTDKYESVIKKLCETLNLMDDKDFQKIIEDNEQLNDIYCTINDTTNRLESIQRKEDRTKKNKGIIKDCIDIECQFHTKYKDVDRLTQLIKEYRENNNLTIDDNTQNLIKAITVEAGELLEIYNFKDNDEKVSTTDILDELADILIYCFELARNEYVPVDRVIARKIKKNLERGRQ